MIKSHKLEVSKCPSCGGNLKYDFTNKKVICEYCGMEIEKNEIGKVKGKPLTEEEFENYSSWDWDSKTINCKSCGVSIELSKDNIVTFCPYCNSTNVIEIEEKEKQKRPDGIIPFSIDVEECQSKLGNWLNLHKVAPKEFLAGVKKEKPVGVFVPYWCFSTDVEINYYKEIEDSSFSYSLEKAINKEIALQEKVHKKQFDELLVLGSKYSEKGILDSISEYDFSKAVSYNYDYFNGFMAEKYSIGIENAWEEALAKMEPLILKDLQTNGIDFAAETIFEKTNIYNNTLFSQYLLPVWIINYEDKEGKHIFVVNGQTGQVFGECPVDYIKLLSKILGMTIVFLCLHYIFFGFDIGR